MAKAGVDRYSRADLAEFATNATTFGLSGVSAVNVTKLPGAVGKGVSFGKEFVRNNDFRTPLTFNFEAGKFYSGLPFDEVKFRNPIQAKNAEASVNSKAFNYEKAEATHGAANFVQAEKMRANLELQQIFTKDGRLTEAGIEAAKPIMKVKDFHIEAPVRKVLSERGNIEQWHKCRIRMDTKFHVPGKHEVFTGEVHVYKNVVTNEIYYDLDYKFKINKLDIHVSVEEFLNNISYTWRPKL